VTPKSSTRLDIEKSASAIHPLEGVVVYREIGTTDQIVHSAEILLRLSLQDGKWQLDGASGKERSSIVGGEDSEHTFDATDQPDIREAIRIANQP